MNTPKTILQLNKKKYSMTFSSGCECTFVSCKNGWGLKLFGSRKVRDYGFENQKKLAKLNLAPKTGKSFIVELPKNKVKNISYKLNKDGKTCTVFGYITQEAKMVDTPKKSDYKKLYKLRRQLKKAGFEFVDHGFHNAAYLNNKLVIIDCNPLSFSSNSYRSSED